MTYLVPDISVMNPFRFQDEPTRVSYGNPGISPEKNQKLSLSADYNLNRLYFSTSISGGYASDVILWLCLLSYILSICQSSPFRISLFRSVGGLGRKKTILARLSELHCVACFPLYAYMPHTKTSSRARTAAHLVSPEPSRPIILSHGFGQEFSSI